MSQDLLSGIISVYNQII